MTTKSTTASMFESIKGALDKASKSSGYRDLLKLEPGKTTLVRLLPNTKNPEDTFYHYFHHGWNSRKTGQYTSAICPSTFGQRSPISEEYFKLYREAGNDEEAKKVANLLKRKESWYVNVFVIDDPVTPENNGKVKILRFGKQLMKIIENAISGEDAEEFGPRIFELGADGCTFRLKPEKKSEKGRTDFAIEYTSSKFLQPKEIPGMTDEKIKEALNSLHDLSAIDDAKTEEQLKEMLAVHFYNQEEQAGEENNTSKSAITDTVNKAINKAASKIKEDVKETVVEDDIDMTPAKNVTPIKPTVAEKTTVDPDDTDAIDALLEGLDK